MSSDRETIVIFTTDHGLQFIRGKTTCSENGLRTSLILHAPGRINSGRVCDALTSHVDLFPTVLELLDLPLPSNRPGASLLPLARGESVSWREFLVTGRSATMTALRILSVDLTGRCIRLTHERAIGSSTGRLQPARTPAKRGDNLLFRW